MPTIVSRHFRPTVTDREIVFWDRHLSGFGVRVYPHGNRVNQSSESSFGL